MMTLTAGDGTVHPQDLSQPAIQAQQRSAQCRPLNFQPYQWTVMGCESSLITILACQEFEGPRAGCRIVLDDQGECQVSRLVVLREAAIVVAALVEAGDVPIAESVYEAHDRGATLHAEQIQ